MLLKLQNTLIQKLNVSSQGENQRPQEELVLDFTYVDIEVKVLNEANRQEDKMNITYDIATGVGS
jgi:hypothetical protein